MKKDKMTFGESVKCSWSTSAQDVIINKKVVGALMTKRQGMLKPLKEWYQILAPEDHENKFDYSYMSEDKGFIFGCFELESEDKYLEYVKKYRL